MHFHLRYRITLGVVALAGVACAVVFRPLDPATFARTGGIVAFTDRAGLSLGEAPRPAGDGAGTLPLAAISPHFVTTIVATEDARFAHHPGIDPIAVGRVVRDLVVQHRLSGGASTIEMQLARLQFGIARTPLGKVREAVLAIRIDRAMSKDAILTAYVNRLPMGSDLVGVEAGARAYFGVPARDLDLAQSTFLAALPNDPVALDPYAHRAALERRRVAILADLHRRGIIDAEEARRARDEVLRVVPRAYGLGDAPHVAFRLAATAAPQTARIRTTLDRDLQRFVNNALRTVLGALHDRNANDGAALVIDNATGDVLAYAGSPDYFNRAILGRNDGVTALRQPGSTLKPFLYEAAFERRTIRPATILIDAPATYALPGAKSYAPLDFSGTFAGPVRPRIALADSLNVPAVRTLSAFGVAPFLQRLHALGFTHLDRDPAYYGLGLTLGSGEVTLEELARAYATMARGGVPLHLRYRADDPRNGATAPIGLRSDWLLVTDMLADAHARARAFGVASLLRLPFPSAVKTGTSSDYRDTWTVGFTRRFTVAVWVGNFDGAPMRRISGVAGAAPLWNRIMLHLAERDEPPRFDAPPGYRATPICADTGALPDAACPAVVAELLDDGDRRVMRAAPPRDAFAIVAPRDGAIYRPGGSIVLRAAGCSATRWSLDGRAVPNGSTPAIRLPLGAATIAASCGKRNAVARVRVIAEPPHRAGFTVTLP